MTQTTVFQSGNSQAVRLPKDFRFSSKTVEIFRRGNEVVLREVPRTMGDLIKHLPNLSDDFPDVIAELDAMMDIINEPQVPDRELDYFASSDDADGSAKRPQNPKSK
jgi:antitoxin VapB